MSSQKNQAVAVAGWTALLVGAMLLAQAGITIGILAVAPTTFIFLEPGHTHIAELVEAYLLFYSLFSVIISFASYAGWMLVYCVVLVVGRHSLLSSNWIIMIIVFLSTVTPVLIVQFASGAFQPISILLIWIISMVIISSAVRTNTVWWSAYGKSVQR